jgi:hypothetical protein
MIGMVFTLRKARRRSGDVPGECANCKRQVWEASVTLDDAYNVWIGKCPYCEALNYLSTNHGLRGYSSSEMHLVLPTDEEAAANGLPEGTPTTGPSGRPADMHGSPLGELCHKMKAPPRSERCTGC